MFMNKHRIKHELQDKNGNKLWFKLYLLEEVEKYEFYNDLVVEKLSQLPDYSDLLCVILVIRGVFKRFTECVLEVKIKNKHKKQYIEYMDKEIYALEHYEDGKIQEIYSKISDNYTEGKSPFFQKELEDLKSPEVIKRERTRKKKSE